MAARLGLRLEQLSSCPNKDLHIMVCISKWIYGEERYCARTWDLGAGHTRRTCTPSAPNMGQLPTPGGSSRLATLNVVLHPVQAASRRTNWFMPPKVARGAPPRRTGSESPRNARRRKSPHQFLTAYQSRISRLTSRQEEHISKQFGYKRLLRCFLASFGHGNPCN